MIEALNFELLTSMYAKEGEKVAFAKLGSTNINRFLIPRHKQAGKDHHGTNESLLGNSLKIINAMTTDAMSSIPKDSCYSHGGDIGEVSRVYRRNMKENLANYAIDDDQMLKVCFLAWRGITNGRRFNSHEVQLERLANIMATKAEIEIMLKPSKIKRKGSIAIYAFLNGVRLGLLAHHFEFWRTMNQRTRRKLAKYFDKWNVWASMRQLRRCTATRFQELVISTTLLKWNSRTYKKVAIKKWKEMCEYHSKMGVVALYFRVWATMSAAAVKRSRNRVRLALREWSYLARESKRDSEEYVLAKQQGRMRAIFIGWKNELQAAQAIKEAKKESLERINNSNMSKVGSITAASEGEEDKHDIGSLSGMTDENPNHSKISEIANDSSVSVLRGSVASSSPLKRPPPSEDSSSVTPLRGNRRASKLTTQVCTPSRSSGYGQSPSRRQFTPSKNALWAKRMEALKAMSESFQDENTQKLRTSGL